MIKRILVIDDDEAIRKVFLLALEGTSFQVDTVSSGEKGIEMVQEQSYDLIYIDLKMPGMNGVDTLKKIRKINPDIPVYIITAYYGEFADQLTKAQADGLNFELMMKPLTMDQIVCLTRGILEGSTLY
ncbi:MAG: response regulator [Deltaproteobacteria bacterium]|uniref:response regulator n=1 Tax=Desulfobacula sp. TaxID=2593537 RepID=UPI0019C040F3|nr:response regulator [Candidatus Desulfobacula maris]MBL6993100.1 response regulator [Desulfobacula sp.]